jgi:hypothetical protein
MKAQVVYIQREKAEIINAILEAEKDFIETQKITSIEREERIIRHGK